MDSYHKGLVTRKMFSFDDVIMHFTHMSIFLHWPWGNCIHNSAPWRWKNLEQYGYMGLWIIRSAVMNWWYNHKNMRQNKPICLFYEIHYYVMSFHVMSCRVVSHVVTCRVVSYHIISYHIISYYNTLSLYHNFIIMISLYFIHNNRFLKFLYVWRIIYIMHLGCINGS